MSTVQPGPGRTGGGITPYTTAIGTGAGGFWGGPVGAGIGAAAGTAAGQALSSNSVNFRGKYARNQLQHQRKIWQAERDQIGPNMAEQMKALDAAGLHRLAALGMSTPSSSAPTQQPMIPGQSDYGNVVSEGINTALNVAQVDRQTNAQKVYQGLKLEEQKLRNDWLRTQIANSRMKSLTQAANVTQDIALKDVTKPHSGKVVVQPAPGYDHATDTSGYSLFGLMDILQRPGKLTAEGAQQAGGEPLEWLYSLPSVLQDIGYTLDRKLYDRYKNRKSDPYKNMGKTGYTK